MMSNVDALIGLHVYVPNVYLTEQIVGNVTVIRNFNFNNVDFTFFNL